MNTELDLRGLRPLERVILRLRGAGVGVPEIADRLRKQPKTVDRILEMIEYKQGQNLVETRDHNPLRPIERVVIDLRKQGQSHDEIGGRLGRSGDHVRRIEEFVDIKLSL